MAGAFLTSRIFIASFRLQWPKIIPRFIYCWSSWIWYALMETMLGDKASEVMIQIYGREIHQMPNWPVMAECCVWLSWKECWPGLIVLVLGWYSCRHFQTAVAGNYSYIRFSSLLSTQSICPNICPRVPMTFVWATISGKAIVLILSLNKGYQLSNSISAMTENRALKQMVLKLKNLGKGCSWPACSSHLIIL